MGMPSPIPAKYIRYLDFLKEVYGLEENGLWKFRLTLFDLLLSFCHVYFNRYNFIKNKKETRFVLNGNP